MTFVAPTQWLPFSLSSPYSPSMENKEKKEKREISSFPTNPVFCLALSEKPENQVLSLSRIGSNSMDAEVYRIQYFPSPSSLISSPSMEKKEAALKIMPLLDFTSEAKNLNEIKIALKASSLVKNNRSPYFPLVYASGFCDNVQFFPEGKFNKAAGEFATMRSLQKQYPQDAKKIERLFKAKLPLPLPLTTSLEVVKDKGQAHYLVSELADEDLLHWSQRSHTDKEWSNVIQQVVAGIDDMHQLLKIRHQDLHLGNVLLLGNQVLLHDFGHSESLENDEVDEGDLLKFFTSLEKVESLPSSIKYKVTSVLDAMESQNLTYQDLIDYFSA